MAEIGPHLLPLDVAGVDAEDDIRLAPELLEEPHLDVGVVAGQDPGGMVVEEELAAELEVELVLEAAHPFEDGFLLFLEVVGVVESDGVVHERYQPFWARAQRVEPFMIVKSSKRPYSTDEYSDPGGSPPLAPCWNEPGQARPRG